MWYLKCCPTFPRVNHCLVDFVCRCFSSRQSVCILVISCEERYSLRAYLSDNSFFCLRATFCWTSIVFTVIRPAGTIINYDLSIISLLLNSQNIYQNYVDLMPLEISCFLLLLSVIYSTHNLFSLTILRSTYSNSVPCVSVAIPLYKFSSISQFTSDGASKSDFPLDKEHFTSYVPPLILYENLEFIP